MIAGKSNLSSSWTLALTEEAKKPVFPQLPQRARGYLLALTLFLASSAVMTLGNAALLRYGFSWALVSLLIIVAAANLWGARAAVFVLVLSALFGAAIVPHLSPPPSPEHGSFLEILFVRSVVFVACGATTIWLTYRAQKMQKRAERRREVVAVLQTMILPTTLASAPGFELSARYLPARRDEQVGGDFYDFYTIGDDQYVIMIGDVMGKGKEAAASTALLRYSVRAYTSTGACPGEVMRQVDAMIETQNIDFGTASLFLGYLNARTGALVYTNAGHEPPMLRRANGTEEILDSTGPLLGIGLELPFVQKTAMLGVEDSLLLMTDGVTEARNDAGQFLGPVGAWMMFRAALRASSAKDALESLDAELKSYIGDNARDDIAMLLLQRTSNASD